MPGEVVHGDVLVTVRTPRLLSQVDALNVIIQQLLSLELLLAVATLVVTDLLVEILDVVVEILVLLVADVTGGGLGEMNLLDVVLQGVLRHKLADIVDLLNVEIKGTGPGQLQKTEFLDGGHSLT